MDSTLIVTRHAVRLLRPACHRVIVDVSSMASHWHELEIMDVAGEFRAI